MSEPQKIKGKLLSAQYIEEAKSILLVLECENGRFRTQIPRASIATFGDRSEREITTEMNKYADMLKHFFLGKDKCVTVISDPDLNEKIKDGVRIEY